MLRIRKRKWGYWIFDLWVVCFTAFVVFSYVRIDHLAHSNRTLIAKVVRISTDSNYEICTRINNINHLITETLIRSKINLPKLTYYKFHKNELKAQEQEVDRELKSFKPRACKRGRR